MRNLETLEWLGSFASERLRLERLSCNAPGPAITLLVRACVRPELMRLYSFFGGFLSGGPVYTISSQPAALYGLSK